MKAIVELTDEEHSTLAEKWRNLKILIRDYHDQHKEEIDAEMKERIANRVYGPWYFKDLVRKIGYAHYTYRGEVSQRLIDALGRMPDSDEIIMLVDDGFSHFGATCSVYERKFRGRVNTD